MAPTQAKERTSEPVAVSGLLFVKACFIKLGINFSEVLASNPETDYARQYGAQQWFAWERVQSLNS